MSSVASAILNAVEARLESEWGRTHQDAEPTPESSLPSRHAIVAAEGSPAASAFGARGETVQISVIARFKDGTTETIRNTKIGEIISDLDGWTPSVSGYAITPMLYASQRSMGNSNGFGQWMIRFVVSAIPSGSDVLITSENSDFVLDPATDLNSVAFSLSEGTAPRQGETLGIDGIGTIKAGVRNGGGRFVMSGDSWPPDPGTYTVTFTLTTGVTRVRRVFIESWQVLVDSRAVGGVIVFELAYRLTWDQELDA